ncbi:MULTISPECIES: hypothetical protein [unclassified Corallococcus]|uniref:hypothetical protein n=1 Tax=unclassified Corallococcus TaxID=2685029 RepID=UPI001A8E6EB5|nr:MULTISPECIES: hypothetical protein [unclassified Corallococcus]MBN9687113.1 hypothetical protein [Corallococcus sp. NCSPR001]WAS89059.1 hypothetical protein O0N60_19255 [Corallococcus sp. NCRR]
MPLFDDESAEQVSAISIRLPVSLWARIDAIAQRETAQRKAAGKKPAVISRNALVGRFLELACDDYEKREGPPEDAAREKKKR